MIEHLLIAVDDAVAEARKAHEKHGDDSMFFAGPDRGMTILVEEVGEAAKEINDASIRGDSPYNDDFYNELVQSAAMALTMAARVKLELETR